MTDHEITVTDERRVVQSMQFNGNSLAGDVIRRTNTLDDSVRRFECRCGEGEMDYDEAVEHMQSVYNTVDRDLFDEVAHNLYRDGAIPAGEYSNGFVYGRGRNYVVGMEMGDVYIIAPMRKGTETRGGNEPRMKTRRAEYVKVTFYEVDKWDIDKSDPDIDFVEEHGRRITTGYVNGYMVTRLSDALDEVFKYMDE